MKTILEKIVSILKAIPVFLFFLLLFSLAGVIVGGIIGAAVGALLGNWGTGVATILIFALPLLLIFWLLKGVLEFVGITSGTGGGGGGGAAGGGGGTAGGGGEDQNPLFRAEKVERALLSDDKILRDREGREIGRLSKDRWGKIFGKHRQIIKDSSGEEVGRIEEDLWAKLWGGNKQIIKDKDSREIGEITTNILGERVIKDSAGRKVGTIRKNILGETIIEKDEDYERSGGESGGDHRLKF